MLRSESLRQFSEFIGSGMITHGKDSMFKFLVKKIGRQSDPFGTDQVLMGQNPETVFFEVRQSHDPL